MFRARSGRVHGRMGFIQLLAQRPLFEGTQTARVRPKGVGRTYSRVKQRPPKLYTGRLTS